MQVGNSRRVGPQRGECLRQARWDGALAKARVHEGSCLEETEEQSEWQEWDQERLCHVELKRRRVKG